MILGRLALGAAAAWAAYTLGAHVLAAGCVRRGPATRRRIALTFDDGPDAVWTERTLVLLDKQQVRASFFLVGERAARAPETVRRIVAAGHEIGSHGWSHRSLWLCGPRRTEAEIGRAHRFLSEAADRPVLHFRPPWGMVNAPMFAALRRCGERCVFWSIQPEGLRAAGGARRAPRPSRRHREPARRRGRARCAGAAPGRAAGHDRRAASSRLRLRDGGRATRAARLSDAGYLLMMPL